MVDGSLTPVFPSESGAHVGRNADFRVLPFGRVGSWVSPYQMSSPDKLGVSTQVGLKEGAVMLCR